MWRSRRIASGRRARARARSPRRSSSRAWPGIAARHVVRIRRASLVVPVVDDAREHVGVGARCDRLEEVAHDAFATVVEPGPRQSRTRPLHRLRAIDEDAAQPRRRAQDRLEQDARPAAHVDEVAQPGEVVGRHQPDGAAIGVRPERRHRLAPQARHSPAARAPARSSRRGIILHRCRAASRMQSRRPSPGRRGEAPSSGVPSSTPGADWAIVFGPTASAARGRQDVGHAELGDDVEQLGRQVAVDQAREVALGRGGVRGGGAGRLAAGTDRHIERTPPRRSRPGAVVLRSRRSTTRSHRERRGLYSQPRSVAIKTAWARSTAPSLP